VALQHSAQAQQGNQDQLFLSMVEQLAQPLLQVSQLAQLAEDDTALQASERWQTVQSIVDSSLQLIESYSLSMRIHGKITPLAFEPVAISALLYDTAHELEPFAKQYGVKLLLDTGPKVEPIVSDRAVLHSALTSLGQVFVLSQAENEDHSSVHLNAHKNRYGIVAGLYGCSQQLGVDSLRRAHALQGKARQPLQQLVSGPAAGVFVADSLLQALAARLHVAHYRNLTGLAATLHPAQQMQLV